MIGLTFALFERTSSGIPFAIRRQEFRYHGVSRWPTEEEAFKAFECWLLDPKYNSFIHCRHEDVPQYWGLVIRAYKKNIKSQAFAIDTFEGNP